MVFSVGLFAFGVLFHHHAAHTLHLVLVGYVVLADAPGASVLPGEADEVGGAVDASLLDVGHRHAHEVICLPSRCAPEIAASADVAAHDEHDFPIFEVVEIFEARDAYLAHKQLKAVVGGYAFFSSSAGLSSSSVSSAG